MKRFYSPDGSGKSAPAWLMYPVLVLAFPIIMAMTIAEGLWHGVRDGVNGCKAEIKTFKEFWRSAR